jgi:transcriptional regulator with XRE-family HTH domain
MTPFGAKVRVMRAARSITLKDMAAALGVSGAYLSAMEHGHRGRPSWPFVQRVITYFNVIWDEAEELERLAQLSDPRVSVNTAGLDPRATELANRLATIIGDLKGEQLDTLLEMVVEISDAEPGGVKGSGESRS